MEQIGEKESINKIQEIRVL